MTERATAQGFDTIAGDYDQDFGANPVGAWMRRQVWERLERLYPPGARLLEIGCGTGIDAVRLAQGGRPIVALDVSRHMVEQSREKVEALGLQRMIRIRQLDLESADLPVQLTEGIPFDGAYSNFGVLNCFRDLPRFSRRLSRLISPGGYFLACVMTRPCVWETGHYLLRFRPGQAFRRFRRDGVTVKLGDHPVWTRYESAGGFHKFFARHFRLIRATGLGILVPPPYLHGLVRRAPRLFRLACRMERRINTRWPLRLFGDHTLLEMKRLGDSR